MFSGDLPAICLDVLSLLGFLERLGLIAVLVLLSSLFLLLAFGFLGACICRAGGERDIRGNDEKQI